MDFFLIIDVTDAIFREAGITQYVSDFWSLSIMHKAGRIAGSVDVFLESSRLYGCLYKMIHASAISLNAS